jgi:hypothetical protein
MFHPLDGSSEALRDRSGLRGKRELRAEGPRRRMRKASIFMMEYSGTCIAKKQNNFTGVSECGIINRLGGKKNIVT